MNKMIKLIEKASIKVQPGKYNKLRDSCIKLQAILDRKKLHKSMGKVPNYQQELSFYGVIIPGLIDKVFVKIHPGLPEKTKLYFLNLEVEEWIQKNLQQCSTFIKVFNKSKLPSRQNSKKSSKSSINTSVRRQSTLKRKSTSKSSSSSKRRSSL